MPRHPVVTEDLAAIAAAPLPWERLAGRTVLVSGAAGFLPAYMVEALLYRNEIDPAFGVRVVGLVRNPDRARERFAGYAGRRDLELVAHDVTAALAPGIGGDVIVHAASQASPRFYETDPVGTIAANTLGTQHLLERAREAGAEGFLFFSSGEVYGEPPVVPTPEDRYGYLDPTRVRSCYGESKRLGETLCVAYHHQHGVPATIVRPFHTYGPGVRLDDGRVFADFVADAAAGRPIVMRSAGTAVRAFCYLADAVAGFLTVLLRGEPGQAYNVGTDQPTSILELARTVGDAFGLEVVEQPREPGGGYAESTISRNAPDIAKVRALGWAPATPLREGFVRTVATVRDAGR
jgi:UDP-glucuronate decarboxylase